MSNNQRAYQPEFYLRLRGETRGLIAACGGIECAATLTRIGQAQIGRVHNRHGEDWLPADAIADLEEYAGKPVVSRMMVNALGFEVVKLPEALQEGDINLQLAAMFKEVGEISQKIGACLADDGCISKDEVRTLHLRKEVSDALSVLVGMDQALQQIEEGGL